MKYLSDYMQEEQTKALDENGAFFAFGMDQFSTRRKEGVVYVSMGAGMICPKENAPKLHKALDTIYKNAITKDMEENGKRNIIRRELANHECWYVGDPTDCINKLEDYPITEEEILTEYRNGGGM